MHDQKRLGALLAYVQWGVNMLVGIVFTPILLRHLGESEYGVYSVATSVIAFLTMLDLGFGQTLVRFYVKYRAEGDRDKADRCSGMFLEMYLVLGAAALGICALLTHAFLPRLFGAKFTPEELSILRQVLSILSVNLAASFPLSVFSSLITAQERFAFAKLMSILNTLFTYGGMLLVLSLVIGGGVGEALRLWPPSPPWSPSPSSCFWPGTALQGPTPGPGSAGRREKC